MLFSKCWQVVHGCFAGMGYERLHHDRIGGSVDVLAHVDTCTAVCRILPCASFNEPGAGPKGLRWVLLWAGLAKHYQ
jgi:hypothetical protein